MKFRRVIRELIQEAVNRNTDRDLQIQKIIEAYKTGKTSFDVCHSITGVTINKRGHMNDVVVLCGVNRNSIYHSYLVDSHGKSLVPGNPDVDFTENKIGIMQKGHMIDFPYVEFIKVDDLFVGAYQWN